MTKPDSISPPFDEPHTGARFLSTHWSLIIRAGQDDSVAARQALGELCRNFINSIKSRACQGSALLAGRPPALHIMCQIIFPEIFRKHE